jgi:hypothetical protein
MEVAALELQVNVEVQASWYEARGVSKSVE